MEPPVGEGQAGLVADVIVHRAVQSVFAFVPRAILLLLLLLLLLPLRAGRRPLEPRRDLLVLAGPDAAVLRGALAGGVVPEGAPPPGVVPKVPEVRLGQEALQARVDLHVVEVVDRVDAAQAVVDAALQLAEALGAAAGRGGGGGEGLRGTVQRIFEAVGQREEEQMEEGDGHECQADTPSSGDSPRQHRVHLLLPRPSSPLRSVRDN